MENELRAAVHRINEGTVLGNALEALIGAIYLDMGYTTAKQVVMGLLQKHLNFEELLHQEGNHKSRLIEWSQREQKKISFVVNDRKNLPEEERFEAQVMIDEIAFGKGMGRSKKIAEQKASQATFEMLNLEA
ncbi:hypothetical protein KFE98_08460 [bacterium SCSIO 12741]|nr:hypothetical protein KFE98_08460 [bacterium SCSIO 12741]